MWGTRKLAEQAIVKIRLAIDTIKEVVMEIARLWSAINSQSERITELEARVSLQDDMLLSLGEDVDDEDDGGISEDGRKYEENGMAEGDFMKWLGEEGLELEEEGEDEPPSLKRSLIRPGAGRG